LYKQKKSIYFSSISKNNSKIESKTNSTICTPRIFCITPAIRIIYARPPLFRLVVDFYTASADVCWQCHRLFRITQDVSAESIDWKTGNAEREAGVAVAETSALCRLRSMITVGISATNEPLLSTLLVIFGRNACRLRTQLVSYIPCFFMSSALEC